MCQPGKPSPQGLGHFSARPGSAAFHRAKSRASRFSGSTSARTPSIRPSAIFPERSPYAGKLPTEKYTLPWTS